MCKTEWVAPYARFAIIKGCVCVKGQRLYKVLFLFLFVIRGADTDVDVETANMGQSGRAPTTMLPLLLRPSHLKQSITLHGPHKAAHAGNGEKPHFSTTAAGGANPARVKG